ncbi:MAG TPA: flagellar type III secretion system pore protein FliP [Acidimicrobiales bacterium]|nr:flagellar type III secretion system pore protein FliP [Acidimicrobiales bacterium]
MLKTHRPAGLSRGPGRILKRAVAFVALAVIGVGTLALAVMAAGSPGDASPAPAAYHATLAPAAAPQTGTDLTAGTQIGGTQIGGTQIGGTQIGGTQTGGTQGVTTVTATPPQAPDSPSPVAKSGTGNSTISVNLGGALGKPSQSIAIMIGLTLLAVAPSLLIMLTSFTRIIIVLSLTRQALGLQSVPPNQLLAGLALFLTLFVMSPVISQVDHQAVQPYMAGKITAQQAYTDAQAPIKEWMLRQTRADDLAIFEKGPKPTSPAQVPMTAVVPAFALSEIRTAFIIGFVVFIPFLVIDLVVSATLMSLGMMMLPPSLVSLPFKLLLFVLVDGWALVVKSLLASFH